MDGVLLCQLGDVGDAVHRRARRCAAAPAGWRGSPDRRPSPSRRRNSGRPRASLWPARAARRRSPRSSKSASTCGVQFLERHEQVVLGAIGEPAAVDGLRRLAAALAQDVDDALVGGRQRAGFRAAPRTPARRPGAAPRGRCAPGRPPARLRPRSARAARVAQQLAQAVEHESADAACRVGGDHAGRKLLRRNGEERRQFAAAAVARAGCAARRARAGAGRTGPCRRWARGRCPRCRPACRACPPAPRFARPAPRAARRRRSAASSAARWRRTRRAPRRRARRSSGPSAPCSSGNSPTMSVTRSAFASMRRALRLCAVRAQVSPRWPPRRRARARRDPPACRACCDRRRCRAWAARDSSDCRRSWSKKNLASASRARSTRSLPATIADGSVVSRLLTSRKRLTSLPASSASAKYRWFSCIVRIRHSCGTSQERGVERARVDDRPFDQRRDLVQQRVGHDRRRVACRAFEADHDRGAARGERRDDLAFGFERRRVGVGGRDRDVAARTGSDGPPVTRPASRSSARTGTTSAPCSATSLCAGRTNLTSL